MGTSTQRLVAEDLDHLRFVVFGVNTRREPHCCEDLGDVGEQARFTDFNENPRRPRGAQPSASR